MSKRDGDATANGSEPTAKRPRRSVRKHTEASDASNARDGGGGLADAFGRLDRFPGGALSLWGWEKGGGGCQ